MPIEHAEVSASVEGFAGFCRVNLPVVCGDLLRLSGGDRALIALFPADWWNPRSPRRPDRCDWTRQVVTTRGHRLGAVPTPIDPPSSDFRAVAERCCLDDPNAADLMNERAEGDEVLYGEPEITFLEALWGDGFLSPGGPEEVARTLAGIDITGATVLDIGCGSGGATIALVRDHGAGHVIGVDVEGPVCHHARARVARHGLADSIEIHQVEAGPLPFDDASVDIVFSKDSIVHIPAKETLAADVYRVLRPGGWFVASDWLIAHDDEPSAEMAAYIAAEALYFGMASPARYRAALAAAGFVDIELRNRNAWYRDVARAELDRLTGPERGEFEHAVGAAELERQIATWRAMLPVLVSGEHCPHHLRARRPVSGGAEPL